MFGKANQYATVSGFGVRVKDEREKDKNHIIETTFEVPLTWDLADEILPAMARDLFHQVSNEWVPKAEIQDASFNLATETQLMTVRAHPELEPLFKVAGVSLRKVKARKTEGNTWVLVVTASWILGVDLEATAIIRALKTGVYLTMEAQQVNFLDGGQAPENTKEATVGQGGNVTKITDGKKKKPGRPRKTPEAEAQDQNAAGQAMNGGDDAAAGGE